MSHASRPEPGFPPHHVRAVTRRLLALLAAGGALLFLLIRLTGGLAIRLGPFRLRAHDDLAALTVSMLAAAGAVGLAVGDRRGSADDLRRLAAAAGRLMAPALVAWTFAAGVAAGTFTAGGADSSGYLNLADLLTRRQVVVDLPLAKAAPWPNPEWSFVPLGFRPAIRPDAMVPTYSPGFPAVMAVARQVGGRDAAFLVVPLCGALAVWLTIVLGRRVWNGATGLVAGAWLASSPIFLFQLVQPMSDVPTLAWWLASATAATRPTVGGAIFAGAMAALAIATRPNLLPLTLLVGALIWWCARTNGDGPPRLAAARVAAFAAAVTPGVVAMGVWQWSAFGSAVRSGYGAASELFGTAWIATNARRYATWTIETQSPLVLLALAVPFAYRRADAARALRLPVSLFSLTFIGAVSAAYLVYAPFDDWTALRFLLPAWPFLLLAAAAVCTWIVDRAPSTTRAAIVAAGAVAVACLQLSVAAERGVFAFHRAEARYRDAGEYVARRLPAEALVVTVQHSGSTRYYADRPILRWDAVEPTQLDNVLAWVRGQGYHPFLLLERWEEPLFRDRFGASEIGKLDWPARATDGGRVAIYDPDERRAFAEGAASYEGARAPEMMGDGARRR